MKSNRDDDEISVGPDPTVTFRISPTPALSNMQIMEICLERTMPVPETETPASTDSTDDDDLS
ncbi:MAG: hypothetical protein AAGD25_22875 [Cyanobacteria bacterium P01_F01_bin.150]